MNRLFCVLQIWPRRTVACCTLKVRHKAGGRCTFDHLVQSGRRGALNPDFSFPPSLTAPCIISIFFQTDRQTACSGGVHWDSHRWRCDGGCRGVAQINKRQPLINVFVHIKIAAAGVSCHHFACMPLSLCLSFLSVRRECVCMNGHQTWRPNAVCIHAGAAAACWKQLGSLSKTHSQPQIGLDNTN